MSVQIWTDIDIIFNTDNTDVDIVFNTDNDINTGIDSELITSDIDINNGISIGIDYCNTNTDDNDNINTKIVWHIPFCFLRQYSEPLYYRQR